MYQVGRAEEPHHNDPYYDTEAEALAAARQAATGDLVYAVWRWHTEDDAETLYLIYQEEIWKRH